MPSDRQAVAEQAMAHCLERLRQVGVAKAEHTIGKVASLWSTFCIRRLPRVPPTPDSVRVVAAHARDPRIEVRLAVLAALSWIPEEAAIARPAIEPGLDDEDFRVRRRAVELLSRFPDRALCLDGLTRRLDDPIWSIRWEAVRALAGHRAAADLAAVLLAAVPKNPFFYEDWCRAARALSPKPAELAVKLFELEQR